MLLGLALYAVYLLLRSRALWGALRAAYPRERIRWRDVWGAYMVGYAINNVFPLGGGSIAQLFLTRMAIPNSSYPTVAAALATGVVFDWFMGLLVMCFAFTQGVFPKPPDFSKLPAFDISFFASHMRFTLFLLTLAGVLFLVGFALLSARVKAFWERVRQGLTILRDFPRYRRDMVRWQLAELDCAFCLLLGAARRVPHRRVGTQRAPRARRAGGGVGVPVHPGRRRRPAGAAARRSSPGAPTWRRSRSGSRSPSRS